MTQPASMRALVDACPMSDPRDGRDLRAEVAALAAELTRERALRHDAERRCAAFEERCAATAASRDEFLGAAAHELKTPLAALRLQVQGLLRRGSSAGDPEAAALRLRSMNRQLVHMTDLLDRLFELGRADDDVLDLTPDDVDLVEVIRDVVDRYADDLAWARCPLTLELPDAPVVGRWDRLRLDQAITNLVTNAKKYGRGAPIEIALSVVGDDAIVCVTDHGIGIAPADIAGIFDRYVRAGSPRSITGLGLGLWIVRRIVEQSGGAVEVESEVGVGSTFTVVLPRLSPDRP